MPNSNPNGCADVKTACCPGTTLPRTLTATITSLSACGCADGLTVPLKWLGFISPTNDTQWVSDTVSFGTCAGQTIALQLLCVAGGAFKLLWQLDVCGASGDRGSPDSKSGCPGAMSLVYDNIGVALCCGVLPPPTSMIRITITS
jgi:hypothetical protein